MQPDMDGFRSLLERFGELRRRVDGSQRPDADELRSRFVELLAGYRDADDRYLERQKLTAGDFNLLEVLQLVGKETRHSMVLAWLLDRDVRRHGTHAQGALGFRLFLEKFELPAEYADCDYWVRREVAGQESIVDVEVACRGRFLLHIENKIWSSEGADQTNREWSDICRRSVELSVDPLCVHAFFLTPTGVKPTNPNFRAVSWSNVIDVLDKFAFQAPPPEVKMFAAHYAQGLKRFVLARN